MKLAIISHTEHYLDSEKNIVGWGPTISELNHLAEDFEEIYHVAFLFPDAPPPSSLPYLKNNIHFIPLHPVGGKGTKNKLNIVASIPAVLRTVKEVLKKVDVFQLRTPTGIGVYLIPYLTLFSKKKGWYKYAGNWNQENSPLGYALQRKFLKNQKRSVTINGKWTDQPKHCLTFENPCLTESERREGALVADAKLFSPPFTFCFAGRLEDAKGVQRIIDAFTDFEFSGKIEEIHFIGDGPNKQVYEEQCNELELNITFHGFLQREHVFEIYRRSHFFLLPTTASEGFPKVIAEAMNFGCIPIVSNVSSIGQYVDESNGFVVEPCTSDNLQDVLKRIMTLKKEELEDKKINAHNSVFPFTFENYRIRIWNEIISETD